MKQNLISVLVMTGIVIAGCSEKEIIPENRTVSPEGKVVRITASANDLTKVNADDSGVFTWEEGDAIGIWTGSELTEFTLESASAGSRNGTFVGTLPEGGAIDANSFAVYPYKWVEKVENGVVTFKKTEGGWTHGPAKLVPMVAKPDETFNNFHFKHTAAIVKFTLMNIPTEYQWMFIECYGTMPRNLFQAWSGGIVDTNEENPVLTSEKTYASGDTPIFNGYADGWYIDLGERTGVIDKLDCYLPIVPDTYSNYVEFKVKPQSTHGSWSDIGTVRIGKFRTLNNGVKPGELHVLPSINYGKLTLAPEDQAFLQALIDGNLIENAPASFDPEDPQGFSGFSYVNKSDYKYISKIDGAPLLGFPKKMHLKFLNTLKISRGRTALTGPLPEDWSTPNLEEINMCFTGLKGTIPEGFANQPKLASCFMDGNDFYGALPHIWNVPKLEILILNQNQHKPNIGYLVPASLDILFNSEKSFQGDKTQLKLGGHIDNGAFNGYGDFEGYEVGWGQRRWSVVDAAAAAGNEAVWNDARLFGSDTYTVNGVESEGWPWYFTNFSKYSTVPKVMKVWNQADADAYTASCIAAYE